MALVIFCFWIRLRPSHDIERKHHIEKITLKRTTNEENSRCIETTEVKTHTPNNTAEASSNNLCLFIIMKIQTPYFPR